MSYDCGRAAMNLEMSPHVPRTEANVDWHIMGAVTGGDDEDKQEQDKHR